MARVVGKARPVAEGVGSGMKLSETGIFIAAGVIIAFSVYWYFVIYKHSPEAALSDYIAAIKSGSVEKQFALIDQSDKKNYYTSEKVYERNCQQARGYAERVTGSTFKKAVPDPKDPDPANPTTVTIQATISLRGPAGKDLIDNGQSAQVTDTYCLHKDSEDEWKVVLSKGWPENLLKQKPNPPGDSF